MYYPGVTDKSQAKVITVSSGQEIASLDITVGKPVPTYEATGQALDDSGQPVEGAKYYDQMGGWLKTDENGRFRLRGLEDGNHSISFQFDPGQNYYSEQLNFSISGAGVKDLQVKVHRGASISGTVVLDGNQDPDVLSQMVNVSLDLQHFGPTVTGAFVSLNPDDSFQIAGLAPGTASFSVDPAFSPPGFHVVRIERDGAPQPDGIMIGTGDQVTGVRVVLAYGAGVLRGQIAFEGGTLPPGTLVYVEALRISEDQNHRVYQNGIADARGRFQIDELLDGQYELSINWFGVSGQGDRPGPMVTVTGGQAPEVNILVDLSRKD